MTQEQLAARTAADNDRTIEIHAAIHLVDDEVRWSVAAGTYRDLIAAIQERAVQEYRDDPAAFTDIANERQAAEQHGDVLNELGVLITETFHLNSPHAEADETTGPYIPGAPECVPIGDHDHDARRSGARQCGCGDYHDVHPD